jgi:hypothetical protein
MTAVRTAATSASPAAASSPVWKPSLRAVAAPTSPARLSARAVATALSTARPRAHLDRARRRPTAAARRSATRRHLLVAPARPGSLELDRHLLSMELDPELLYRTELAEPGGET